MEYSIKKVEDPDEDLSYLAGILRASLKYSLKSSRSYEEVFKEFLEKLKGCVKEENYKECVKKLYWKEYVKYDYEGLLE